MIFGEYNILIQLVIRKTDIWGGNQQMGGWELNKKSNTVVSSMTKI